MSAQFLEAFVSRVLHDLVRSDRIEIMPNSHARIINPNVEELYAENDEIKEMIVDLGL